MPTLMGCARDRPLCGRSTGWHRAGDSRLHEKTPSGRNSRYPYITGGAAEPKNYFHKKKNKTKKLFLKLRSRARRKIKVSQVLVEFHRSAAEFTAPPGKSASGRAAPLLSGPGSSARPAPINSCASAAVVTTTPTENNNKQAVRLAECSSTLSTRCACVAPRRPHTPPIGWPTCCGALLFYVAVGGSCSRRGREGLWRATTREAQR